MENSRNKPSNSRNTWYQKDYTKLEAIFDAAVERSKRKKIIYYNSDRLYTEDSRREIARRSYKAVAWAEPIEEKDIHTEIIDLANEEKSVQVAPSQKDDQDLISLVPESSTSESTQKINPKSALAAYQKLKEQTPEEKTEEESSPILLSYESLVQTEESTSTKEVKTTEKTEITVERVSENETSFLEHYYKIKQEALEKIDHSIPEQVEEPVSHDETTIESGPIEDQESIETSDETKEPSDRLIDLILPETPKEETSEISEPTYSLEEETEDSVEESETSAPALVSTSEEEPESIVKEEETPEEEEQELETVQEEEPEEVQDLITLEENTEPEEIIEEIPEEHSEPPSPEVIELSETVEEPVIEANDSSERSVPENEPEKSVLQEDHEDKETQKSLAESIDYESPQSYSEKYEAAFKDLNASRIALVASIGLAALYAIFSFSQFYGFDYIGLVLVVVGIFLAWDVRSRTLIYIGVIMLATLAVCILVWVYQTRISVGILHYAWFFLIPLCMGVSYAYINSKRLYESLAASSTEYLSSPSVDVGTTEKIDLKTIINDIAQDEMNYASSLTLNTPSTLEDEYPLQSELLEEEHEETKTKEFTPVKLNLDDAPQWNQFNIVDDSRPLDYNASLGDYLDGTIEETVEPESEQEEKEKTIEIPSLSDFVTVEQFGLSQEEINESLEDENTEPVVLDISNVSSKEENEERDSSLLLSDIVKNLDETEHKEKTSEKIIINFSESH